MMKRLLALCMALVMALFTPLAYAANPYLPANPSRAKINGLELDLDKEEVTLSWYGDEVSRLVVTANSYTYDAATETTTYTEDARAEAAFSPDPISATATTQSKFRFDQPLPPVENGFRLIAWVEDANGVRISDEFVDDSYTVEMLELDRMTMNDKEFSGLTVIDASKNFGAGSFLALKSNVTLVHTKAGGLVVTPPAPGSAAAGNIYELSNMDAAQLETYAKLQKGDVVCVIQGDEVEHFYGLQVESVQVRDGKVYLLAKPGELKIDEYTEAARLKNVKFKWSKTLTLDTMTYNITTDFNITLYFDFSHKGLSASFTAKGTMNFLNTKLSIKTPSVGVEAKLVTIPLAGIPALADVEFNVNLEAFVSGSFGFVFDIRDAAIGFRVKASLKHGISINELCDPPNVKFLGTELDGEVFVGLGIGISGNLLSVLSVALKVYVGPVAHLNFSSVHYWDKDKRYHACKGYKCWSLTLKVWCALAGTASLGKLTWSINFIQYSTPALAEYFHSSTFGDEGNTLCPHQGYRLYVDVKDLDGNAISGVTVSNTENPAHYEDVSKATTDANGRAAIYLPTGQTKVDAQITLELGGKQLLFYNIQDVNEQGYAEETTDLITESIEINLDTRQYSIAFSDPAQSGTHDNWPATYTYYRAVYASGEEPRLPDNIPTRSGNIFVGWSTDPNATPEDPVYSPGDVIDFNDPAFKGEETTLYAVWKLAGENAYHIIYVNKPGEYNTPQDETYYLADFATDTVKINNVIPMRLDGWTFSHWEGTPSVHNPDGIYERNEIIYEKFDDKQDVRKTVRLEAKWIIDPAQVYHVHYDVGNAPVQTPASQTASLDDVVILRECPKWDDQHIFRGWAIEGGTFIPTYFPRMAYTFNRDVTLVAVWETDYRIVEGDGSSWVRNESDGPLRFVGNGDDQYFFAVEVDGSLLETRHYTRTPGSTIIDLHESYLQTLGNSEHFIKLIYQDGETPLAYFTVSDPPPVTGDNTPVILLTVLVTLSGAALVMFRRKKEA